MKDEFTYYTVSWILEKEIITEHKAEIRKITEIIEVIA